jgi:hypothetical protein
MKHYQVLLPAQKGTFSHPVNDFFHCILFPSITENALDHDAVSGTKGQFYILKTWSKIIGAENLKGSRLILKLNFD